MKQEHPCNLCSHHKWCFEIDCKFYGYNTACSCQQYDCFLNYEGMCKVQAYDN